MENLESFAKKLRQLEDIMSQLGEYAASQGVEEKYLNYENVASICLKRLRQLDKFENEVSKTGTTLANVVKAHRMRRGNNTLVPREMTYAPPHWQREASTEVEWFWEDGKRKSKVVKTKAVDAVEAQRLRKKLQPQIVELFEFIAAQDWDPNQKEEYTQEVVQSYVRDDYQTFLVSLSQALWAFVHGGETNEFKEPEPEPESRVDLCVNRCMSASTVYSATLRQELIEWWRESEITVDEEELEYWACSTPNKLFVHLMNKVLEGDVRLRDYIKAALIHIELIDPVTGVWSEKIHLDSVVSMKTIYRSLSDGVLKNLCHEDISEMLTNTLCLGT